MFSILVLVPYTGIFRLNQRPYNFRPGLSKPGFFQPGIPVPGRAEKPGKTEKYNIIEIVFRKIPKRPPREVFRYLKKYYTEKFD